MASKAFGVSVSGVGFYCDYSSRAAAEAALEELCSHPDEGWDFANWGYVHPI